MGIYIRDMKMPKDCPVCPLAHWNKLDILTGCELVWRYVPESESAYWQSDTRPEWCPLVEVPPHEEVTQEQVAAYCRSRNFVLITREFFRQLMDVFIESEE